MSRFGAGHSRRGKPRAPINWKHEKRSEKLRASSMGHAWCRDDEEEEVRWSPHQWQTGGSTPGSKGRAGHRPRQGHMRGRPASSRRGVLRGGQTQAVTPRPSPWTVQEASSFPVLDHLLQRYRWEDDGAMGGRKLLGTPPPAVVAAGTGTVGQVQRIVLTSSAGGIVLDRARFT
jgi:hypothetical protein